MKNPGPDYKDAIRNPPIVPALLRRAIMHVFEDTRGSALERFENAFNIAVWRLTEGCKNPRLDRQNLHLTRAGVLATRAKATDAAAVKRLRDYGLLIASLRDDLTRRENREKASQ